MQSSRREDKRLAGRPMPVFHKSHIEIGPTPVEDRPFIPVSAGDSAEEQAPERDEDARGAGQADHHRDRAEHVGRGQVGLLGRRHQVLLERPVRHHALVFQRPLFLEALERHRAREDHRIHRERFRPQVRVEEVEQEDEARGQQRLVAVDDVGRVERPARQELREEVREPQHQARDADHRDAPEHRQVVELLPVREPVELRTRAEVQEVLHVGDEVLHVGQLRHHRTPAPEEAALALDEPRRRPARPGARQSSRT